MKIAGLALLLVVELGGCCGGNGSNTCQAPDDTVDAGPDASPAPPVLSKSGLYSDFGNRTIAAGYLEYTPAYILWADDLGKRRWIYLPAGQTIDTADMDHWVFPVGTRIFKEFAEPDGTPLEMRLFEKLDASTWNYGAFVWREGGTDADWTTNGATAVRGTTHDVPGSTQCFQCHSGETDKILGFSAIQLSNPGGGGGGLLTALAQAGQLSNAPAAGEYAFPWDDLTNAAVGYLHANCGHCHNPLGSAAGLTSQLLRFSIADLSQATWNTTAVGVSTIGVPTDRFMVGAGLVRIHLGDHTSSATWFRMSMRASGISMPPIATIEVDMTERDSLAAWIDSQ